MLSAIVLLYPSTDKQARRSSNCPNKHSVNLKQGQPHITQSGQETKRDLSRGYLQHAKKERKYYSNKQAHKWSAETQSVAQTNGES